MEAIFITTLAMLNVVFIAVLAIYTRRFNANRVVQLKEEKLDREVAECRALINQLPPFEALFAENSSRLYGFTRIIDMPDQAFRSLIKFCGPERVKAVIRDELSEQTSLNNATPSINN